MHSTWAGDLFHPRYIYKRQPAWCEQNTLHVAAVAGCDGMRVLASDAGPLGNHD